MDHSLKRKKERRNKFKETGNSRYIHQNELDKACFQHDMAYGAFKYLSRRTASDKVLVIKHFILLKIQLFIIFFHKTSTSVARSEKSAARDKFASAVLLKMKLCQTKN